MTTWINAVRRLDSKGAERSWLCTCSPSSKAHAAMVRGVLRNMNRDDYVLDDGIPVDEWNARLSDAIHVLPERDAYFKCLSKSKGN